METRKKQYIIFGRKYGMIRDQYKTKKWDWVYTKWGIWMDGGFLFIIFGFLFFFFGRSSVFICLPRPELSSCSRFWCQCRSLSWKNGFIRFIKNFVPRKLTREVPAQPQWWHDQSKLYGRRTVAWPPFELLFCCVDGLEFGGSWSLLARCVVLLLRLIDLERVGCGFYMRLIRTFGETVSS